MEATGRDGDRHEVNVKRRRDEETESSSRSGTIVSISTGYTSSASRHSSTISAEMAARLSDLEMHGHEDDVLREAAEGYIKFLVRGFSASKGGDMSVLERWFTELGVGWVLHLNDGASAGILELTSDDAQIWIRALGKIMKSISHSSASLLPPQISMGVGMGLTVICEEEEGAESYLMKNVPVPMHAFKKEEAESDSFILQFARFIRKTLLKMVAFVDVVVDLHCNNIYQKMSILLLVRNALSEALSEVSSLSTPPSTEMQRIRAEMILLLDAKVVKLGEFIWTTFQATRTSILKLMEDTAATTMTPQGSSDIHKLTWSAFDNITFLLDNHSTLVSLNPNLWFVYEANLEYMIVEMASSLKEKLASLSKSFSDQGLMFLFLLNNLCFICKSLQGNSSLHLKNKQYSYTEISRCYIDSYLQVSWVPMLSCLFDSTPTPVCLFCKNYSRPALHKFESEFHKTYAAQKIWKVPDPELRKRLRTAITRKIIPAYTEYIEENNVTMLRVPPHELEGMLQDLFEG